jgi:pyruvate/2-oxoglutarate dehydrogenase complex dihydrolipoamide dehydrogenase (E3) component
VAVSAGLDAIVIGTGQSGPALATRLTQAGRRVAVVERGRFGGTCVNYGCTPTKALVASARAAHMARRAADFGVEILGAVRVDMKAVKARKDAIAGRSNEGVESWMKGLENAIVLEDQARFEGPRRVRVGEEVLEAGQIFINVGARARLPGIPGLAEAEPLTSSTILDLETLPEHLVVLGGGYVGVEFAQMYRRFGSRVTIIDGSRLMAKEDEDVSAAIAEIFAGEGIEVVAGAEIRRVDRRGEGFAVAIARRSDGGGEREVLGSHVLAALGRQPNTDDLGLESAGIATDEKGFITVDDRLRTTAEGVWAMGDCNGRGAFTHTSYNDYEIIAANLLDGDDRRVSERITAYAAYTDPPFARVGASEGELRRAGRRALVARLPMSGVARARERSETAGFMKILVDPHTRQILGAALLGIRCDEVAHLLLDAMYARAPYTVIQRAVHIHPTVAELIPTMLGQLEPLE